ncbi:MAG: ATP-binding protein [Bacteroidota bacterium]|nr:ATP-binding protein [Bacteroidota bacterium]
MEIKDVFKELIRNFQDRKLSEFTDRSMQLPMNTGKIVSLTGVRRSGKTYILYQSIAGLYKQGIKPEQIIFINFEDERLPDNPETFDMVLQAYRELFPDRKLSECYFFFDEIQNIDKWEKFVRRLNDQESKNIFITGSNSKLLGREIATELRGRAINYELYPLGFKEYLAFRDIAIDLYVPSQKAKIIAAFDDFLFRGGFPETIGFSEHIHRKVIQEYFNTMLFRDIVERYNVADVNVLKFFVKKIIASVTSPLSVNKIYNEIRSNKYETGKNVLYDYLRYVEEAYMTVVINKYDHSIIKQENSNKKVYAIDNSFLPVLDYYVSSNKGKLLENFAALEFIKSGKKIFYFKQIKECDFIVESNTGFLPIQVAFSIKDTTTRKRELDGLMAACKYLDVNKGMIISYGEPENFKYQHIDVQVVEAYKYFL